MTRDLAAAAAARLAGVEVRSGAPVRIPCPSGILGDVLVYDEDDGVIVEIEGWTHGHFDHLSEKRANVSAAIEFVASLVADQVGVFSAGEGAMGGWFYLEHGPPDFPLPDDVRFATWSRELAKEEL